MAECSFLDMSLFLHQLETWARGFYILEQCITQQVVVDGACGYQRLGKLYCVRHDL